MSAGKELLKLGTYFRNLLLTNVEYREARAFLGVDRFTDPTWVLSELENSAPEVLDSLLERAKNSPVKDYVLHFRSEVKR